MFLTILYWIFGVYFFTVLVAWVLIREILKSDIKEKNDSCFDDLMPIGVIFIPIMNLVMSIDVFVQAFYETHLGTKEKKRMFILKFFKLKNVYESENFVEKI